MPAPKPTEPSAAALEAMIAEQLANPPEWWPASKQRQDRRQGKSCDSGGRPRRLTRASRKPDRTRK